MIETEWTLNASLTRFSSYRKCSKRRILGHSAQATSVLRIAGTTKCSRIALGFGCGSSTGFAAEVKPEAGLGFRASAAFCARNNMSSLCPSLGPLPDATVSAPVLLFGRLSPTRRQEFPLFGRRPRTAQADLAGLLPGAGIAAHILRALRECRSGFATHGMPNPSASLPARVGHGGQRVD
jgi:hypothetical protein